jgi:hypothetical protein
MRQHVGPLLVAIALVVDDFTGIFAIEQPPDRWVVLKGYENGYADVSGLRERQIKLARIFAPSRW